MKFKGIFNLLFKKSNEVKTANELTKSEVSSLFRKIIFGVHENLKKYSFEKKGTNHSYRIVEEIYQSFYFQKSSGNNTFTVSICIRPIYWHRPEIFYLLSTRRLGEFETGNDKWYEIQEDTKSTIEQITSILEKFVLPIFEKSKTSSEIVLHQNYLMENKVYDKQVVLFSAMRTENKIVAQKLLKEVVTTFTEDDRNVNWVINDRKYFNYLYELVELDKWGEIQNELALNTSNFYKVNKLIH